MVFCEALESLIFVRLMLVDIFVSDCELYAKMRCGLPRHPLGQQPAGSHTIPLVAVCLSGLEALLPFFSFLLLRLPSSHCAHLFLAYSQLDNDRTPAN